MGNGGSGRRGSSASAGPSGPQAAAPVRSWADVARISAQVNHINAPIYGGGLATRRALLPGPKLRKAENVRNSVNLVKDSVSCTTVDGQDLVNLRFKFDSECSGKVLVHLIAKQLPPEKVEDRSNHGHGRPVFFDGEECFVGEFGPGRGQEFGENIQIDFGKYTPQQLLYHKGSETFPIVISLERDPDSVPTDATEGLGEEVKYADSQCTYFTVNRGADGKYTVEELQRAITLGNRIYVIKEMYGSVSQQQQGEEADENRGKDEDDGTDECVVCLSEPKNTTILPCMHMCLCMECAGRLTSSEAKCPLCRSHITEFWTLP